MMVKVGVSLLTPPRAVFALMVAVFAVPVWLLAQAPPELTTVAAVRSLSADQAREQRPVRLRGVVTVVSGWKASFFFQDETAGISVDRADGGPELRHGQWVEIRGVTGSGKFAPVIAVERVRVLGKGKLPVARLTGIEELTGGKLDSQWIAIKGIVRTATVRPSWGRDVLFLDIDVGGGTLVTVRTYNFRDVGQRHLLASTVYVRGVCATNFNDRRQFVGLRLFVASLDDVQVLRPGPADPFDRPLRPLSELLQFNPGEDDPGPVKVRGVVSHFQPEQGLYLQDGGNGLLVHTTQATPVKVGAVVEAVGYPGGGGYSPSLENSIFRVIDAPPTPLAPVAVTAAKMIVENDGFATSPYDSLLVRVKGRLVEAAPGAEDAVIFVRDGAAVFTARLPKAEAGHGLPPPGSVVEVTGICVTRVDSTREAVSFRLLLRSASDIAVLESAPWWSASHAKTVVAALLVAVLLLAAWLAILRREAGLRRLALTDPLTGLYNRRGFVLLAEHQWQLALRSQRAMLLFYIDVNDFKTINDSLGHKEGDAALQLVAAALRECFRKTDLIGRLGGDEFAVTAIEAVPHAGEEMERRLSRIVEQSNRKPGRKSKLSLSVGVLVCDESLGVTAFEDLLDRADTLMYEKKAASKTRVHGSGELAVVR